MDSVTGISGRKITALVVSFLMVFTLLFVGTKLAENVDAHEILVVQDPYDGELHWYTTPGLKSQMFGSETFFPKVINREFEAPIRFNDNGHGKLVGSVQFRLPVDATNLTNIYTTFHSPNDLAAQLLQKVIDKSVLMSGALLSSTESSAEKRSNLIFWVEDQMQNGVYKTNRRDIKTKDPITGEEKTVTVAEITLDKAGLPERQEPSQLASFGIVAFNFTVSDIPYDKDVEEQIQVQRRNIMAVQTAIAQSKAAEQQALTAEQEGRANAAKAKWEQETIRAKEVTEGQQKLDVARLDAAQAAQERQANILRGEGEAARRKLVMSADGALSAKLEAYVEAQKIWAAAISNYKGAWVPEITMGANGATGGGATALMDLLTAKTAKDLNLDLQQQRTARVQTTP